MKTRIIQNWRSTLLGLALLAIIIVMLFMKIIKASEFITLLPTILGLIYVQDSIFNINPKKK